MSIFDDIYNDIVGLIHELTDPIWDYAYDLYISVWNYATQISNDLWHETALIWDRIGEIPVLTYDVIVGWVMPLIYEAEAYALDLVNDVISVFDPLITALDSTVNGIVNWKEDVVDVKLSEFSTWITDAPGWFSTQLEAAKDTIIDWVIDKFEYILDRVFTEEE